MAELCDGEVIFYGLARNCRPSPRTAPGGRALVVLRENRVMLATGESKNQPCWSISGLAIMNKARRPERARACLLAAIGAAWAGHPGRPDPRRHRDLRAGAAASEPAAQPPAPAWRPVTPARPFEGLYHGSLPYPSPARPQPVEPPHRHRGGGVLHRRRVRSSDCPASRTACARAFPNIGLRPIGHEGRSPWPTPWPSPPWPAGPGRLPGHLQPHRAHARARRLPGRRRIHRGSRRPPGHRAGRAAVPRRAGRHALRPRRCAGRCANSTRTCASAPAPAPSCRPPSRAAFPTAA
jgi:hypothetical protein